MSILQQLLYLRWLPRPMLHLQLDDVRQCISNLLLHALALNELQSPLDLNVLRVVFRVVLDYRPR
jgi:hypothetical protein